jgi:hypothetical protein
VKLFEGRARALNLLLGFFVLFLLLSLQGCTHKISVTPVSPVTSSAPIEQSLRVQVPFLALEGADHMPGIAMLEWPAKNLRSALIDYVRQRHTFSAVSDEQGSLTLTVKPWLWMRSRGEYRYIVHFESDLGPTGKPPIKSYVVEKEAVGSRVRWVTASDQDPIAEAVQAVLDDLFLQIEEDATLYGRK